ncbi:hypothetical protein EXIGLDRAFT_712139 [Exidia glandulosa HHB12029]|uniref:Heparinase II/III family protein n=1 Tax=Exidia glandulosa HHB12029 TaxID=1314781 RepID=A0A165MLV6_EXIGL|nr:hypothetical protein EXIGLDRAFT_712139 [Exidia glandulosa HHB12029]
MSYSNDSYQRPVASTPYIRMGDRSDPGEGHAGYYYGAAHQVNIPAAPRKRTSLWIKLGIPVAILVIIAAVVGVVLARRHSKSSPGSAGGSSEGGSKGSPGVQGLFATSTDAYFLPVYPTASNAALYVRPTFTPTESASAAWPTDTYSPTAPEVTSVRPDHPRLLAPAHKWAALPDLIQKDVYLKNFHDRILANASDYIQLPPVQYYLDGDSGILDISRQVKQRIKAYAYAYRMTNDQKWLDGAWAELQNAANKGPAAFSPDPSDAWNKVHFLDVAEMTAAFAIAYDWLYDFWSPDQRSSIMQSIIDNGLNVGLTAYTDPTVSYAWWTGGNEVISGNWNCVCNGGMVLGALAIIDNDQSGVAAKVLAQAVPNARANCAKGPSSDGSWTETPNYWYFGTTGHAEMTSALMTATGSDYNLLTANPNFSLTGLYHMYVYGMTSLFDYADHGPNKYSSTANSMMFYATAYNTPMYMLYQRDRFDAADPTAMFWYDPTVAGAWWNGLPLDHVFNDAETSWASMRSSWTDNTGLYVAMKSSKLTGHQTHGDLDCGDFVLDAMGQRWAGELGSGNYLSKGYFSSGEGDNATRWLYYRKRTEGQNTLLIGERNQLADEAAPTLTFETSGTAQAADPVLKLPSDSAAFVVTDMSTAYGFQS